MTAIIGILAAVALPVQDYTVRAKVSEPIVRQHVQVHDHRAGLGRRNPSQSGAGLTVNAAGKMRAAREANNGIITIAGSATTIGVDIADPADAYHDVGHQSHLDLQRAYRSGSVQVRPVGVPPLATNERMPASVLCRSLPG